MGRLVSVPVDIGAVHGGLRVPERLGEYPAGAPRIPAAAKLKLPGRLPEFCRATIAKLGIPGGGGGGAPGLGDRDRGGPDVILCTIGEFTLGEFIASTGGAGPRREVGDVGGELTRTTQREFEPVIDC